MNLADALDPSFSCPHCSVRLRVTHTYITDGGKTQDRLCDRAEGGCGTRFTATISVVMIENTGRGKGAYALANKLKKQAKKC